MLYRMPRDCTARRLVRLMRWTVLQLLKQTVITTMPKKQTTRGKPKQQPKRKTRKPRAKRNTQASHPMDVLVSRSRIPDMVLSKPLPFKPLEPVRDNLHGWGQRSYFSLPVSQAVNYIAHPTAQRAGMFVQYPGSIANTHFGDNGASLPINPMFFGGRVLDVGEYFSKFRVKRLVLSYVPDVAENTNGSFSFAYFDDVLTPVPQGTDPGGGASFSGQLIEQEISCASRVTDYCQLDVPVREKAELYNTDMGDLKTNSDYRQACQGKLVAVNQTQSTQSGSPVWAIGRLLLHAVVDYFSPGLKNLLEPLNEDQIEDLKRELRVPSELRVQREGKNEIEHEKFLSVKNPVIRTAGPDTECQGGLEKDERRNHDKSPRPTSSSYRIFG